MASSSMGATIRLERKSKCCRLCNDGKIIADLKSPVRGFFFIREKEMMREGMNEVGSHISGVRKDALIENYSANSVSLC